MKFEKDIKIIVSDFDGVFTDGKIEVFSDGSTSKKMDYKDIMAIALILRKDIKFAIISGEKSVAIDRLKDNFPQIEVFQGERKKINVFKSLLEKYGIAPENSIYIGDDVNDIECLNYTKNNQSAIISRLVKLFNKKPLAGLSENLKK
jgi:3-deoxy-D-manno-octulosonate 8-phosphate phosphatase (KDO 8-P phosphatase)